MIHRWIHRRALLAWLLLPWLALLLSAAGLVLIDMMLGDAVSVQDWSLRSRQEWLWQVVTDAPLLLAGLYGAGSMAWGAGVLLGGRSARRSMLVLGLLCGLAGLLLGRLAALEWNHPASLVLGAIALVIGSLYAALTHRPSPRVLRHRPLPAAPLPTPPPPPPPARPPSPAPVPTLIRHEAPTTLPAEY